MVGACAEGGCGVTLGVHFLKSSDLETQVGEGLHARCPCRNIASALTLRDTSRTCGKLMALGLEECMCHVQAGVHHSQACRGCPNSQARNRPV